MATHGSSLCQTTESNEPKMCYRIMAFIIWTLKKNSSEANLTLVNILYEFKFPLNIRQFGA